MLTSRLGEQIILVRRSLQVLVSRRLHIASPRDLYLDVWPITDLFLYRLLLASRAVEILSCLINNLILRCASHGKIYMLGRASPSRACSSFRSIMSISFDTLNQLPCFGIDFGKGIYCVILVPVLIS